LRRSRSRLLADQAGLKAELMVAARVLSHLVRDYAPGEVIEIVVEG
jgi:hypothetical protein